MMVWKMISFFRGVFSGSMLIFRGVDSIDPDFQRLTTMDWMDWGLPRPWFTMGKT